MSDHKPITWEFEDHEIPRAKLLPRIPKGDKPQLDIVEADDRDYFVANCVSFCGFSSGHQMNKEGAIRTINYHMRKSHR